MGHRARHGDGDFRRRSQPEYGLSLLAVDFAVAGAVQCAARLVARAFPQERLRGPTKPKVRNGRPNRYSMRHSARPPMKVATSICPMAATSKISGFTKWCGGAAASLWSSMPAAIL